MTNLYLDMDGVVADWHSAAEQFLELRWAEKGDRIPREQWQRIKSNSRFYLDLPLKPGGQELVQYCQSLLDQGRIQTLQFLSALPQQNDMPFAAQDKVWWANRYFPGIPVFLGPYSHDKWRHCRPGDILIDDRYSNCEEWEDAQGRAYRYDNWLNCEQWLAKLFDNFPERC